MNKKKLAAGTPQTFARIAACLSTVSMAILMGARAHAQATESSAELRAPAPDATQPVDIEVFKSAQILTSETIQNNRASSELGAGREGWVVLNMMIDSRGKPYEVMVQDSSGNSAFEKAALNAIGQVRFAPAQRGDTAIDSSFTFKFMFSANRSDGASRTFVNRYEKFSKAVAAGDKATADSMLQTLYGDNLYEQAFEHYARYFYFSKWGTPADQLKELAQALAGEKNAGYLPKEAFVHALMARFSLQARTRDYGGALSTWSILEPLAPGEHRANLTAAANEIKALQGGGVPLQYPEEIGERGGVSFTLFRNRFGIDVNSGAINEIKLRCEKKYLFFKYQPAVEYSIGNAKDQCSIEVIGDPGTRFVLRQ